MFAPVKMSATGPALKTLLNPDKGAGVAQIQGLLGDGIAVEAAMAGVGHQVADSLQTAFPA